MGSAVPGRLNPPVPGNDWTAPNPQCRRKVESVSQRGAQEPLRMVFLVDELDVTYAGRLGATLADAVERNDEVRVDLSAVRAIDSSCIRELLRFQAVAARDGKSLSVVAPNANVRRLLIAADAVDLLAEEGPAVAEVAS